MFLTVNIYRNSSIDVTSAEEEKTKPQYVLPCFTVIKLKIVLIKFQCSLT